MSVSAALVYLLQLLYHPFTRQSVLLCAWSGVSIPLLLITRTLLHYSILQTPCFLALGAAGFALLGGRLLIYAFGLTDPLFHQASIRPVLHVLLLGGLLGAAAAFSNTALQRLHLPVVLTVQAASPAASYAAALLLRQREPQLDALLTALLVCAGVLLSLWPGHQSLCPQGLTAAAAGVALEALWVQLHILKLQPSTQQPQCHSCSALSCNQGSQGTEADMIGGVEDTLAGNGQARLVPGSMPEACMRCSVFRHASPLVLLADCAPAAALVLALPTAVLDGAAMDQDKFRYRPVLPAAAGACVLACCVCVMQFEPSVAKALAAEPSGVLARLLRDGLIMLAANAGLNEGVSEVQVLGYVVAQLGALALCCCLKWGGSSGAGAEGAARAAPGSEGGSRARQVCVAKADGKGE